MIRRLVLLVGLWAAAVVPATGTPIGLPPAPWACAWVLLNDGPAAVLVCPEGPILPPVPGPPVSPVGFPAVDPPPVATGEAGTGILLIVAWVAAWWKARR